MSPVAVSPRGPGARASVPSSPPHSPSSTLSAAAAVGARDTALMRFVHENKPFHAPHGTKGAAWEAVSRAMRASMGVSWQGIVCRNRVAYLLDRYDRQRAGKPPSAVITAMDQDVLPILEETLMAVAKTRVEAQIKSKEKALVAASAALKSRDEKKAEKKAERERERELALMKERDEKRAAAVVAAAARARDAGQMVNTATVVAKRRKRKGVKTKEQKNATAGMFEVLRQSREEYLNQLRVQTAAEAAAEATGEENTLLTKKPHAKSSVDLDLHVLRAVAKCSPYSQETKEDTGKQWVAVTERVMKYCNLKFTATAIRDRCEALIKDFEANNCKKSTFGSGVAVADEERLSLLRVIRKAHDRQARSVGDRTTKSPESSQVEKDDSAIEIEDEQADDNDSREDELEQWGSLEENRVEGEVEDEEPDEQVEESLVDDTQDEEEPEPNAQQHNDSEEPEHDYSGSMVLPVSKPSPLSLRKRRRSESGASPDADPAVDMDLEQLQLDDNSLDWSESQDFTPRKYKQQRVLDSEQDEKTEDDGHARPSQEQNKTRRQSPSQLETASQLSAVIHLVKSEREERRIEFKAMLELVKQQNDDRRSEWEREHERRTREQAERQRELTSLVGLLTRERKDRKSEMLTMLEAMNKDRDDRREEFKAMVALMTKMVETRAPGSS